MLSRNTSICLVIFCFGSFIFLYSQSNCSLPESYQYKVALAQLPFFSGTESPPLQNSSTSSESSPEPLTPRPPPSTDEVPDSGNDEMIKGEPAMSYFRKLAQATNNNPWGPQGSGEKIRILAAYSYKDHFSATIAVPKKMGTKVFCRYIGKDGKEVAEPVESAVYPFFVVYCSRKDNVTVLGITGDKAEPLGTHNSVTLIRRKFKEYQHNVSYCLAPIYGKEPKWLHFVELVEHYKLQGVNKFFIYIREISDYDRKLIQSYVDTGEVEIIDIPGTVSDVIAQQLMGVADCLLRSRTYSKWSIFSDIDERLIMTDDRMTIDRFMRNLTDESIGSVAFPQRWIMKREQSPAKFESDEQVIQKMPTRAWHETTSAAMKGHPMCHDQQSCWAKDIVHNEKAIRMLVHEVINFYPGYQELFLDPAIGYIRHYRDVDMQSWEKNNIANLKKFGPFSNTNYPGTIGAKLLKNVLSRLHRVYSQ